MITNKRKQQKEATRQLILQTAYNVYAENGFSATTSDIAKAAGISHGTIFAHFPSLENLLDCLLADFGHDINDQLHQLSEHCETVSDMLHAHISGLTVHEKFYTRLISETSLLPSEAANTFIGIQSTVSSHFGRAIENEIKNDTIKQLPQHFLFNTWVGIVHYYLQNSRLFAPGSSVLARYGDELTNSYLELVKK